MTSIDALYLAQALALKERGQLEEACQAYAEAIRLNPGNSQALVDLAGLLAKLGRDDQAQAVYADALAQAPNRVDACILRGNALYRLKRFEEALAMQDRALELTPDFAPTHYNRGNALHGLERNEEAIVAYDRALALDPALKAAQANKGAALQALRRYEEAIACQDVVEAMSPGKASTASNRGASLLELRRYDEAALDLGEAIRRAGGDHPASELHLASISLLREEFKAGWRQMEARKRTAGRYGTGPYSQPEWLGAEDIVGKTVLVHAEQGLGDTIQFCRYLPMVRALGARVVFACQDRLRRLISTLDPDLEVVGLEERPDPFDYHVPLLSLPLAFDTRLETIPAASRYLAAEPERIAAWRRRLGASGYHIGVAWMCSPQGAQMGKAFPVSQLQGLAGLPGVRLISLQRSEAARDLNGLPPGMTIESLGEDFDSGDQAFLDTAAVIESLDLVIAADTAVAHLAAALGRPTWMALKHAADWRWLLDRSDTPWYPSMRLFRQPAVGDWNSVFAAMERELAARLVH